MNHTAVRAGLIRRSFHFCLLMLLSICFGPAVQAATFTVTNTNASGAGSLADAITSANTTAGADNIAFNIPGGGVKTITLSSELPEITEGVLIDGTTQPEYAGFPVIVLYGTRPSFITGLTVSGGQGTILRGLCIQNFTNAGIHIKRWSVGTMVESCFIGTDETGSLPVGNRIGIVIGSGTNSVIGSSDPSKGNVISGNTSDGIQMGSFQWSSGDDGSNTICGNFIGTDAWGIYPIPNGGNGIRVLDRLNTIGGESPTAGNVISGNAGHGIFLEGIMDVDYVGTAWQYNSMASPNSNAIKNNLIGTDAFGDSPLGNGGDGIRISMRSRIVQFEEGVVPEYFASANINVIGSPTAPNVIAFNAGDGVRMLWEDNSEGASYSVEPQLNAVKGNSIYANGGLGIDLDTDGPNPNDANDADTGANGRQNAPVLQSARRVGTTTGITYTLNTNPNTNIVIHFFYSPAKDPSGFGEGQHYLGAVNVVTNDTGNAGGTSWFGAAPYGSYITATASTSLGGSTEYGDTSEFSNALLLGPEIQSLTLSAAEAGGTRTLTGTVTLTAPAPAGGVKVLLSSNNAAATVPSSVTVAAGATQGAFNVNTQSVSAPTAVTITARYATSTKTASLTVLPWIARDIAQASDGSTRILMLSGNTLRIQKWTGSMQLGITYVVPGGWSPVAIAADSLARTFVLLKNGNTSYQLWIMDSNGARIATPAAQPADGWTPTDISAAGDGTARVLLVSATNQAKVVRVNGATVSAGPSYTPNAGWNPVGIAAGADNKTRLLWRNGTSNYQLWTLSAASALESAGAVQPAAGFTAREVSQAGDGSTRILLVSPAGQIRVNRIGVGAVQVGPVYSPAAGYSAVSMSADQDNSGLSRLLWQHSGGALNLWTLQPGGSLQSAAALGAF